MAYDHEKFLHPSSRARDLRWQAVKLLSWMFPKPYNFNSSVGFGMRKLRLERELAAFDMLYRLRCARPASFEELYCAGMLLVAGCKGRLPASTLPLDEDLLINLATFDDLLSNVGDRLAQVAQD